MRAPRFSRLCADAKADAVTRLLDGGWLELYDGARPAGPEVPASAHQLLAALRFGTPSFAPSSAGVAQAYGMVPEVDAPAGGQPTWFRSRTARGVAVFDGEVGPPDDGREYDLTCGPVQEGGEVVVERLAYREPPA